MNLVFVAKDMGSFNVTCPVARLAREEGDTVTIIGEGLAAGLFEEAGFRLWFKGTVNHKDIPFSLDAGATLRWIERQTEQPVDFVITGLGSPINLEGEFGLAANQLGLKLACIEDFWHGVTRTSARAGVIFTLDEWIADLDALENPQASVFISGNPGVPKEMPVCPMELDELRKRFGKAIVYVGAGERTAEEITFLLACLENTKGDYCLLFRPHGKHVNRLDQVTGRRLGDVWEEMFRTALGERLVYLPKIGKTDPIVAHADVTVASFSTLLTTAAWAEKVAVSLLIPCTYDSLQAQAKLSKVPIVELGCAHGAASPVDLLSLKAPPSEKCAKLKPFDAEVVYASLKKIR